MHSVGFQTDSGTFIKYTYIKYTYTITKMSRRNCGDLPPLTVREAQVL